MAMFAIAAASCGREPTDPSRTSLTGFWRSFDVDLYNVQRLYMANRGIWEAIDSAGPACGTHTTGDDVDVYLKTLDGFLSEISHQKADPSRGSRASSPPPGTSPWAAG